MVFVFTYGVIAQSLIKDEVKVLKDIAYFFKASPVKKKKSTGNFDFMRAFTKEGKMHQSKKRIKGITFP